MVWKCRFLHLIRQNCLLETFKLLGLSFSSKLDWGSYIIFITDTASKKIGTLIRSMKFFFPEVAMYFYKSTVRPCMEYCYHIWAGAPSCYLEMLEKLQKRIYRTVGLSLAASLESSTYRQNVFSLSLIYRYLVLVILIDCMIFLSPFLDVTKMSISTVSFLAQLDPGILCP